MPLLMKHTGPLWGIWKIEESSEVLLSLLRNREEYLPQLELIRTCGAASPGMACLPCAFAGAYGRPGLRSLSSERCALPVRLVFAYQHLPYERLCRRSVAEPSCRRYRHRIPFREGVEDTQSLYESGRRGGYRQRARDGALVASLVCKRDAFQDDRAGRSRLPSPSACPSVSLCGRREFHRL